MKKNSKTKIILLLIFINFYFKMSADLKIICTAALIQNQFENRKKEYIKSFNFLKQIGFEPYIVESCVSGPTFLDQFSKNVFYSKTNNLNLRNKGVNEAQSLRAALKKFPLKDEDLILKLTGRYFFHTNNFIKLIDTNPTYDCFVKLDQFGQVFTGCFAMRFKYFKDLFEQLDLDKMESKMISIESAVAEYIKFNSSKLKVFFVEQLDLTANIFGYGNCQITFW